MKRFLSIITIAVSVLAPMTSFIQPVSADTVVNGAWTWTDLSDQLTTRTNRPIWVTAYANGSWFYTDGQSLSNGGQVYRYDGSTQINITSDVRNAGIDRIDDIVSEGYGVLFLQDVVRLDNTLRVVAYTDGQYMNETSYIQSALSSGEGINQIVAYESDWYITTTKGRLLRWTGNSTAPTVVTLPSNISAYIDHSRDNATYNVNHGSTSAYDMNIGIVPVSYGKWVVAFRVTNTSLFSTYGNGGAGVVVYSFDGNTWTLLPQSWGDMSQLNKIVSNNNQAYLFGRDRYSNPIVLTTSGNVSLSQTSSFSGTDLNNADMRNVDISWNGLSWMLILNNKSVYRFDGSTVTPYGTMRDYLTTAAGDGNGRFLLGGAVSTVNNSQPTTPLTAKLVMVTEGNATVSSATDSTSGNVLTTGGTFGGDRVYQANNGPRVTIQGNPSGFRIGSGKEFAYRVTASDSSGINRIDIYMNGVRIESCNGTTVCEYRATLYTQGQSQRTIPFYTRVTNNNGYSTDTSGTPDTLTVDINSSATADGYVTNNSGNTASNTTNSVSGISSWTWLDPNNTSLTNGNSTTYYVGANDSNGINKIDIYVNGTVVKSCPLYNATGNQQCSFQLYANNYTQGTNVSVNAHIVDGSGLDAWTTMTTLYRSTDNGSSNTSNNGTSVTDSASGISSWTWLDPNNTSLTDGNSTTYYVGANDSNGINKIDIYVNGSVVKTCSLGNATGNQQCSFQLYANNYTQGTNVAVNARITDGSGLSAWTSMTTLYRSTSNGSTYTNTSNNGTSVTDSASGISSWTWLDPNNTSLTDGNSTTYYVGANDANGINRIDIYVNGGVVQTCSPGNATGNQQCSFQLYANNYTQGTNVAVNARITDGSGLSAWTSMTTLYRSTSNGSTYTNSNTSNSVTNTWVWLDPNVTSLNANDSTGFNVGAQDNDGISKIEIVANGSVIKTCSPGNSTASQTCYTGIYGSNFPASTSIFVNAKVTDANGSITWTDSRTLYRNADTSSSNTNSNSSTNSPTNTWITLSPNVTTFNSGDSMSFTVGANDGNGINKIEILANGSTVKTCSLGNAYGDQQCVYAFTGNSYPANTDVFLNAKVTDANSTVTWTGSKTVHRNADTSTSNNTTSNQGTQNVTINNFAFSPSSITVQTGTTVQWTNNDSVAHTVTADGGAFNSSTLQPGSSYSFTFTQAGTYTYHCSIHPDMKGTVTVTGSSTNVSTNTDTVSAGDWLDPAVDSLGPNATSVYHAGSWAQRGVSSVSIYVNGSVAKTCSYFAATGNQDCAFTVNGSSYQAGTSVFVNALVQSAGGAQAWTVGKTIAINASTCAGTSCTGTNATSNTNGWVSAVSDRDTGYTAGGIITIATAAYDPDGVARIDIYTNGTRLKTCNNAPTCNVTATTDFYTSSFSYQAIMTDRLGNAISTGYKTIYKK